MPMMMFPNPQPQATGDGADANCDPDVLVYRPWQPDELKEVAETLPDPQKNGDEKWIPAMQQLLSMYEPTLKEGSVWKWLTQCQNQEMHSLTLPSLTLTLFSL